MPKSPVNNQTKTNDEKTITQTEITSRLAEVLKIDQESITITNSHDKNYLKKGPPLKPFKFQFLQHKLNTLNDSINFDITQLLSIKQN